MIPRDVYVSNGMKEVDMPVAIYEHDEKYNHAENNEGFISYADFKRVVRFVGYSTSRKVREYIFQTLAHGNKKYMKRFGYIIVSQDSGLEEGKEYPLKEFLDIAVR